jgi:hypothetical protein
MAGFRNIISGSWSARSRSAAGVDGLDAGVGQGGAHVDDMGRVGGEGDVVDVVARAREELRVLEALDPVAEDRHPG